MSDIREIIDSLDGDELCKYCEYNGDCPHSVIGGPNGPIYPPCADGLDEDDFDLDTYLANMEGADET